MTTGIKKIVLEIDGKEIELTLEQARKLKDSLRSIFKDGEKKYVPIPEPFDPRPFDPRPYVTWNKFTTTPNTVDNQTYVIGRVKL